MIIRASALIRRFCFTRNDYRQNWKMQSPTINLLHKKLQLQIYN